MTHRLRLMGYVAPAEGVPLANLAATAVLGAVAVVIARGLTPLSADLSRNARTLFAALAIGVLARLFSHRSRTPSVIWAVPAILPLLPAPATLLPLLAETQRAQEALQGHALQTAFVIGVGVATGDILVATYLRYRERVVTPALSAVSNGFSRYVTRPVKRLSGRSGERNHHPESSEREGR